MDRDSFEIFSKTKIEVKDYDYFTRRNGHSAVAISKNEILLFGGQDNESEKIFKDLFTFDIGK